MRLVLFLLICMFLFILVSGAYVFVVACVRRKETPWLVETEIKKTPFGKYYKYIAVADQWLKDHGAQDVYITSKDGLKLHAFWIPADNAKGTVLMAHGYRSTPLIDFGAVLPYYHEKSLNLLIPHQRAHGESGGKYITFGIRESTDMQCWIEFHNENFGTLPIVLNGISMGATTMLFLADKLLPKNVCGIVADCGFTSAHEIIALVFRRVIRLPAMPSVFAADIFARLFASFSLFEMNTRKNLPQSRLPILFIHGRDDAFVPCEMSQTSFNACAEPKAIYIVDGADHGVSFVKETDRYMALLDAFLQEYVI